MFIFIVLAIKVAVLRRYNTIATGLYEQQTDNILVLTRNFSINKLEK